MMAGAATSGTSQCNRRMGWHSIACIATSRARAGSWRRAMTEYVELHARSAFSFLEGASSPEEMAAASAELGMPAMALLDSNGVYGTARLHTAMKRLGLRGIVGAEIEVSGFSFLVSRKHRIPFESGVKRETRNEQRETVFR